MLCSVFILICALVLFHQVKNAMLAGAKGIIMFSDPADYCAPGVHVCVSVCASDPLFILGSVPSRLWLTLE